MADEDHAAEFESIENGGEWGGIVGRMRRLHCKPLRHAVTGRIPGIDIERRREFLHQGRKARCIATDAMQQDDRYAVLRTGAAQDVDAGDAQTNRRDAVGCIHVKTNPASTGSVWPVRARAPGVKRKRIVATMSSGVCAPGTARPVS